MSDELPKPHQSEPPTPMERRTVFVLAGLILAAIVSISFFQLDRHPAFIDPTDELIAQINEAESELIFANDPVALAAAERHGNELHADVVPAIGWPPDGTLFVFGAPPRDFEHTEIQRVAGESVWSLWQPGELAPIPRFATAVVETEAADGTVERCQREADGHHQCGDASWTRVGQRRITVDGDPSDCIWAHPIDNRILRITFSDVATVTDDNERLHLKTALRDSAIGPGVPVEFTARIADQTTTHSNPDRTGWHTVELPAVDEPNELVIEVTADNAGRRHACFDFELQ